MNERIDQGLPVILARLNSKFLYSLDDFRKEKKLFKKKSISQTIAEESTKLSEHRFSNYDHFVHTTTNLFGPLSTNNPELVDKIQLIATLFVLKYPFNKHKPRYYQEIKYRANEIIKTLLGDNDAYLTGDKSSEYIQPIYLILRAFKEKYSTWLTNVFGKLDDNQKQKIFGETVELQNKLLKSINQPQERDRLDGLFKRALNFQMVFEKPSEQINKEIENVVPTGDDLDIQPKHIFHDHEFASNNKQESKNDSIKRSIMKDLCEKSGLTIDNHGRITLNEKDIKMTISFLKGSAYKNKEDGERVALFGLESLIGKNNFREWGLSSFLISMSENQKVGDWFLKGKKTKANTTKQILKIFEYSIGEIFREENSRKLKDSLKQVVGGRRFDFGALNEKIAEIIFRGYHPNEEFFPSKLLDFIIKTPGAVDMIFALRKIFLMRSIKDQLPEIPEAILDHEFFIRPGYEIWDSMNENQEYYKYLSRNTIEPTLFMDYSKERILNHFVLFSVEKYLKDRKKRFDDARLLKTKKQEDIKLFDRNIDADILIVSNGIHIPVQLLHNRNQVTVLYKGVKIGLIPIVVEKK